MTYLQWKQVTETLPMYKQALAESESGVPAIPEVPAVPETPEPKATSFGDVFSGLKEGNFGPAASYGRENWKPLLGAALSALVLGTAGYKFGGKKGAALGALLGGYAGWKGTQPVLNWASSMMGR